MRHLLVALLLSSSPAASYAATIQITAGTFTGGGVPGTGTTTITGDDFTLSAVGLFSANAYSASGCGLSPCASVSPGGIFSGSDIVGGGVFQGTPYTLSLNDASAYLQYAGPTVPLNAPIQVGDVITVEMPFTFSGFFSPHNSPAHTLIGGGWAAITLSASAHPDIPLSWWYQSSAYTFVDPAAVPEPTTILLVGAGVIALARRRLRPR